ncbi:MAG TPA: hypothetical protein VMT62_11775 [Syntrophorhabdaceae bacterium]|nr:hypothetical protein [Syntrophorhabdaceae bacterium]
MMEKNSIEIYALIICFISLVLASVALGTGIYSLVGMKYPEVVISANSYESHRDLMRLFGVSDKELKRDVNTFTEEDKRMLWWHAHKRYVDALALYKSVICMS